MKIGALKPALALFAFTAVSALIVGFMQTVTYEPIRSQAETREREAIESLIPLHRAGTELDMGAEGLPGGTVYRVDESLDENGETLGYVFFARSSGYGGAVHMIVGIDTEGYIKGIRILEHSETPGIGTVIVGEAFRGQFDGLRAPVRRSINPAGPSEIQSVAGATISVEAVLRAVNEAWDVFSAARLGE